MGLQSSDLILVERGNTLYKETYGNRANIESSDLLLVERNNTLYKCTYANWANANSTDLILVERNNTLYKETKSNWATSTYTDIHSANYMVTLNTLLYGQSSNNSNSYSVVEVQIEVSNSASYASGDLYIGFRNSASFTYQGDLPIAAIQLLESNGTAVAYTNEYDFTWNFGLGSTSAGGYGYNSGWGTTDGADAVITDSSASPAPYTYNTIGTTITKRRFAYTTSGTSTSSVGAARGIPTSTYHGNRSTTSILPLGTHNVAQSTSSSDGYIFSECSSTNQGNMTWLQLEDTGAIYNGSRLRICYFGGGNGSNSSNGLQTTNSLYVRFIAS